MSHADQFSKNIDDFQKYGTYTYEFDEAGNIVLNAQSNDFAQVYLAFPLGNFVYDNGKIQSFYDPTFVEFIPATQIEQQQTEEELQQTQDDLETEKAKTEALTQQLDAVLTVSEANISESEKLATKQVIIELRRELSQGNVESDFSEEFPYTPLRKEVREG